MLWIVELLLTGFENKNVATNFITSFEYFCTEYLYSFYNIVYLILFNTNALLITGLIPIAINICFFIPLFLFDKLFHTNHRQLQQEISKCIYNIIANHYEYIQILLKYFTLFSIIGCGYLLYKFCHYKIRKNIKKVKYIF